MLNKVQLIGRLGKDPEFKTTPSGIGVARFSLATDERRKDDSGATQVKTEWHRVVLFRRQAEVARDFLRKGSLIYLEGKIHYDSYDNKDGHKRYTTEIVGDSFQMLGAKAEDMRPAEDGRGPVPGAGRPAADDHTGGDDDLPF